MKKQELTYLNTLAISCLATGLVDEAKPAFELITRELPNNQAGPIGLASIELAKGNYDSAAKLLQQGAETAGINEAQARKILMHALVANNRLDQADELRDTLMSLEAANDANEYLRQSHNFFGTGDPRQLEG